jgi:energy-coupling factor transporter ATP-binding protein EcfA2
MDTAILVGRKNMKLDHNPYIWQRVNPETFVGRENVLNDICGDLTGGKSVGLVGGRKIGKTTLIRKLQALLAERSKNAGVVPVYLDVLGVPSPFNQPAFYHALVSEIGSGIASAADRLGGACCDFPHRETGIDYGSFKMGLSKLLQDIALKKGYKLVIMIDEVEPIIASEWGPGFFSNWRSLISNTPEISPHVSVLFSGAKEMSTLAEDVGSPLANVLTVRSLGPLTWRALRQLALEPTKGHLPISVAREVFRASGGHPFLAQYLLHHICEFDLSESSARLAEACDRFLNSDAGQFVNWWRRHFSRDERTVYINLKQSGVRMDLSDVAVLIGGEKAVDGVETLNNFGVVRTTPKNLLHLNGTLFLEWVTRFSVADQAASVFDQSIYDRLLPLDPEIAKKYAAAWAIYNTNLDNYSGAVGEIRDVLTLTLHFLAPDSQVQLENWYTPEKDGNGNELKTPTRRQRVEFILRNGSKAAKGLQDQFSLFDALTERLGKTVSQAYSEASAKTHKTATRDQAWRCLKQLDSVLAQLL